MPEKARIFHAEADPVWVERVEDFLAEEEHEVVASAPDLKTAFKEVNLFKEKGVQVAIVGDLGDRIEGDNSGRRLAASIKRRSKKTIVVGFSNSGVWGADFNISKLRRAHVEGLARIITDL